MLISRRALMQVGIILPAAVSIDHALFAADGAISGFTHSVASGDPGPNSVRLWTRYVAPTEAVDLAVEISESENFKTIAARALATAGAETDFCAHARIDGLQPARWYYYRFLAPDGTASPVGRTRTLPVGSLAHYRIGVVSCANATSGWFTAYAHAAARDDLDLIVHLGDYIYESPIDRSDALAELAEARGIAPAGEAVALADYRLRYASYRRDPALQELHRRFPMIVIWDDHETANNSWHNGAANHDPATEGTWDLRKAAGLRALQEWQPMGSQPYAEYRIGDLASLFRLETRLLARSKQLEIEAAIKGRSDIAQAIDEFRDGPLADPKRTLMGSRQEHWLTRGLAGSVAAGFRWQVLLQQVIMAPTLLPQVTSQWFAADFKPTQRQLLEQAIAAQLSSQSVPFGLDRWDGYPAARDRLLTASTAAGANLVVLSGDSHNAWAYNLEHRGQAAGIEFGVHAVSSLGLEKRFGGDPGFIAGEFVRANPGLRWCDTSRRGYLTLDLAEDAVTGSWHFLPSRQVREPQLDEIVAATSELGSNRFS